MHIWVTRTTPDAGLTAHRLERLGHRVTAAPVLTVRGVAGAARRMPSAIVFSSANGVRHHSAHEELLRLPVFTVGDRTAQAAREAGYRRVLSAKGNISDLQRLVLRSLPPSPILHFCAREAAGDLAGFLGGRGYRVEKRVVYASEPVPLRSLIDVRRALPTIDAIMVHSPRAAIRVKRLLKGTGWTGSIWCISEACALELIGVPGIEICFARRPTEAAMIEMVQDRVRRDIMHRAVRRTRRHPSLCRTGKLHRHPANDNSSVGAFVEDPEGDPPPAA